MIYRVAFVLRHFSSFCFPQRIARGFYLPSSPLRHQGICYFEVGVIRLMRSGGRDVRKAELTRLRILCLEWRGLVEHLSHKNTNTHLCSCRKHSGDKSQTPSLWLTFKTGEHT